jgi:hypothetical protein
MDLKTKIQKSLDSHREVELKYPNRYKEIHKVPCKNCPSVINKLTGTVDPENEEVKLFTRQEQIKTVFPCGWRPSKLCKGYCDDFSIKEEDLV